MMKKRVLLLLLWVICAGLWITLWAQFYKEKENCFCGTTDVSEKTLLADTVNLILLQQSPKDCVNINEANQKKLETIPGIGPVLAKRIVDHRQNFGKFQNCDELINVKGIGKVKLEKMQKNICF